MRSWRELNIGLGVLLVPWMLLANASEKISLEQAIEKTKVNSKSLQIQNNELSRYQYMYREALGSALPQVSLSTTYQKYPHIPKVNGTEVKEDYELNAGIQVQQALYTFGAVSSALKAADAGLEMGRLNVASTQRDLVYQTKLSYASAILAQTQMKVSEEYLNSAQNSLSILKEYFKGGRPAQGDLIRLEADVAAREIQFREAKASYTESLNNLKRLMGYDLQEEIVLTSSFQEELPDFEFSKLMQRMAENEPTLKGLAKNIQFQESLAGVEKSKSMPKVGAFFSYNRSGMDTQSKISTDKQSDYSTVGLSISWNLWDGGSSRAKYQQSLVDVKNAELQRKDTEEQLVLSLRSSFLNYQVAKKNYVQNKRAIVLAEKSYQMSKNRFRAGKTSVTELNDVEGLVVQSKLSQALTLFHANQSLAWIEKLTASKESSK